IGDRSIYIMLFPAVVLSAVLGGLGPGLLSVFACAGWATHWLYTGYGRPVGSPEFLALGIFTFNGIVIAAICDHARRANQSSTTAALARLRAEQSQQLIENRIRAIFGQSAAGIA